MSGAPNDSRAGHKQPQQLSYDEVVAAEQEVNRTSTPLPLPRTDIVRRLIAEAHEPQQIIYAKINFPTTADAVEHNKRMDELVASREKPLMPGACVCFVGVRTEAVKAWLETDHPCHGHAKAWYHFFHCTRARNEDYGVMQQDLGWCKCEACKYYIKIIEREVLRKS